LKRFVLLALPLALLAHDPITTKLTYNAEISRILAGRCLSCHATGSVPLTTYQEVRKMPPWGAQRGVGQFRNSQSLGQPEIDRIVQWVEGGAPEGEGNPAEAVLHLAGSLTLTHPITILSILPNAPLEAKATRPDGTVERLIWLKEFHGLTYEFAEALTFPKGTVLNVNAASAELFLKY